MLISLVVLLKPQSPTALNRNVSRAMHGLLYALIAESDPDLARELHESQGPKAFTVSPLLGEFGRKGEARIASPEHWYQVRFTAYEPRTSAALIRALDDRQRGGKGLMVRQGRFDIGEVTVDPARSDGWAGTSDYGQLWETCQPSRSVALEFLTSTAFRLDSRPAADARLPQHQGSKAHEVKLLFPLAGQVFGGLARRWNAHAPLTIDGIPEACASGEVVVDRYQLETQGYAYANEVVLPGFVGYCGYRVLDGNPELTRQLSVLAEFARFAGVGQKTTQGMGQARRVATAS